MSLVKKLAVASLLAVSVPVLAEVTLNVGDYTVVTAINGQEVKNGLFAKPERQFTLQPGRHVITAKYNRLYDVNHDKHDVLRSSNVSISVELADNQSYTLIMANQPERYEDAKDYAEKPNLAVVQGTKTIASQTSTVSGGSSIFAGLGSALGGVFGGSKAIESNQQAISALGNNSKTAVSSTAVVPALSTPTANSTPSVSADNTLDQFMQLWLKASPAEREKIRQWIAK